MTCKIKLRNYSNTWINTRDEINGLNLLYYNKESTDDNNLKRYANTCVDIILKVAFEDKGYATDIKDSSSKEHFDSSIEQFKSDLEEYLSSIEFLPADPEKIKFGKEHSDKIKKFIRERINTLFSDSKVKEIVVDDEDALEVMDEKSEKQKLAERSLDSDFSLFFGAGGIDIQSRFLDNFQRIMFSNTIVINAGTKDAKLVTSKEDLNEGIIKIFNKHYRIMRSFLNNHGYDVSGTAANMFVETKGEHYGNLNPSAQTIIDLFREFLQKEYIESKLNKNTINSLPNALRSDYNLVVTGGKSEGSLLEAVQAYLSIEYFNELLKNNQTQLRYIKINDSLVNPIENTTVKKNGKEYNYIKYKYSLSFENNLKRNWTEGDAWKDGMKEIGNLTNAIISSIPKKGKGEGYEGYLTKAEFFQVQLKLEKAILNVETSDNSTQEDDKYIISEEEGISESEAGKKLGERTSTLQRLQMYILTEKDPVIRWKNILNIIRRLDTTGKGSGIWRHLKQHSSPEHKLTDQDLYILKSIQEAVFGPHGLFKLEKDAFLKEGRLHPFGLTYSLYGNLNATVFRTYLLTVEDRNGHPVYRVKSPYNLDQRIFLMTDGINRKSTNWSLSTVDFNTMVGKQQEVKLLDTEFKFKIISKQGENVDLPNGIFGSDGSDIKIVTLDGQDVYDYFRNIIVYLNESSVLNSVLDTKNNDPLYREFRELIGFLSLTFNITFDDNNGLNILYLAINQNKDRFNEILLMGTLIGLSMNLNYEFANLEEYLKDEFDKFLEAHQINQRDLLLTNSVLGQKIIPVDKFNRLHRNVLNILNESQAVILGQTIRGVTKGVDGLNNPNTSVAFTQIRKEFFNQKVESSATYHLLFSGNNSQYIVSLDCDEGYKVKGRSKKILLYSPPELLYHNIITLFGESLGETLNSRFGPVVYMQPIVYSDKVTFIIPGINLNCLKDNITDKKDVNLSNKRIIQKTKNTVGKYYKEIGIKVLSDYARIMREIDPEFDLYTRTDDGKIIINWEAANNLLRNHDFKDILEAVYRINKREPNNKIKLVEELHYQRVKGKKEATINSLLIHYNEIFFNDETYNSFLRRELLNYARELFHNNVTIKVGKISSNPSERTSLQKAIVKCFVDNGYKQEDVNNWIDDNGYLIIAKKPVTDDKGRESFENLVLDTADSITKDCYINPFIESYVTLHSLLALNIKLGINGAELHHPYKGYDKALENLNAKVNSNSKNQSTEEQFGKIFIRQILSQKGITDPNITDYELILSELIKGKSDPVELIRKYYPNESVGNVLSLEGKELSDKNIENILSSTLNLSVGEILNILKQGHISPNEFIRSAISFLQNALNPIIIENMNRTLSAQLKRTNAIPATMHLYTPGKINGIGNVFNTAFIDDVWGDVYDYSGKYGFDKKGTKIEVHNGCTFVCPFTSILENNSLNDLQVGKIKKPLWEVDNPETGSKTLIKNAVSTLDNAIMREQLNSDISQYYLFKRMTDCISWNSIEGRSKFYDANPDQDIDIFDYWRRGFNATADIEIKKKVGLWENAVDKENPDFLNIICEGLYIYKKVGNEIRRIDGLYTVRIGKKVFYITEERKANSNGSAAPKSQYYLHLFDKDSNLVSLRVNLKTDSYGNIDLDNSTIETPEGMLGNQLPKTTKLILNGLERILDNSETNPEEFKSVDTLFKLHAIFGGIHCMSFRDGEYYESEASNRAVVNIMNNVVIPLTDGIPEKGNQDDFYQPLKYVSIHYVVPKSAVKCGNMNLNSSEAWFDSKAKLYYQELDNTKYGTQLDNDHDTDESKVSEPTQIIAALASTSFYPLEVKEIFRAIGRQTLQALSLELAALESKDYNRFYDLLGKTILKNLEGEKKELIQSVLELVANEFGLSTNHDFDNFNINFSCDSLYTKILQIAGSVINRKGVKRKYYGSAQPLVPSYGMYQIYHLDGIPYLFQDLVTLAHLELKEKTGFEDFAKGKIKFTGDLILYEKTLVTTYLDYLAFKDPTLREDVKDKLLYLEPEDVLQIYINGIDSPIRLRLNSMRAFYEFTEDPVKYINENFGLDGEITKADIVSIINDKTVARDLAPSYIRFTYNGRRTNVFATPFYRKLYKYNNDKNILKLMQKLIPQFMENLDKGILCDYDEESGDLIKIGEVTDIEVSAAENVASYNHASRMRVDPNKGLGLYLRELKQGKNPIADDIDIISSAYLNYDYALLGGATKKDIYLSITEETGSSEYLYTKYNYLKGRNKLKIISEPNEDSGNVIKRIYVTDNNNTILFEVGRLVVDDEVTYDSETDTFKRNGELITDEDEINALTYEPNPDGGYRILRYVEILSKGQMKRNGRRYTKFNINRNAIKKVLLDSEKVLNEDGTLNEKETLDKISASLIELVLKGHDIVAIEIADNIRLTHTNNLRTGRENYDNVRDITRVLIDTYGENTEQGEYFKNIYEEVLPEQLSNKQLSFKSFRTTIGDASSISVVQLSLIDIATLIRAEAKEKFKKDKDDEEIPELLKAIERVGITFRNSEDEKDPKSTLFIKKGRTVKVKYSTLDVSEVNVISNKILTELMLLDPKKDSKKIELYLNFLVNYLGYERTKIKLEESITKKKTPKKEAIRGLLETDKYKKYKSTIPLLTTLERQSSYYHNKNFMAKLNERRKASFELSLYQVASRIPAQELQSFMPMKTVGFMRSTTGQVAVSHWQLFLQGSDYDIDKAYMLSYSFNEFGTFIGWSNIFDYSSIDSIKASLDLTYPKGRQFENSDEGIDLSEFSQRLETSDNILKIKIISEVLWKIEDSTDDDIVKVKNASDELLLYLNRHEQTYLTSYTADEAVKNYITYNITKQISHVKNMPAAYSPIEIDEFDEPKNESNKAKYVQQMTYFNPAFLAIMLIQNMQGKKTVGITANAQKAMFISKFVFLDTIRKNKDKLKYVVFDKHFDRIEGRWTPEGAKSVHLQLIPEVADQYLDDPEIALYEYLHRTGLGGKGSQYITAATDNAKELILYVINSGSKMAKYHMYLLSMGFDIKDIVKFMTAPIIDLVEEVSNLNIYDNRDFITINNVIDGFISYYQRLREAIEKGEDVSKVKLSITNLSNELVVKKVQKELNSIIKLNLLSVNKDSVLLNLDDNIADLIELRKLDRAANEYTNLSIRLGINQGVSQTKEQLIDFRNGISRTVLFSEEYFGIRTKDKNGRKPVISEAKYLSDEFVNRWADEYRPDIDKTNMDELKEECLKDIKEGRFKEVSGDNFDVDRWLNNDTLEDGGKYQDRVIEYYNLLKDTYNIFYIILQAPHYNSMYKAANLLNNIDRLTSLKSNVVNRFAKEILAEDPYSDSLYYRRIIPVADLLLIEHFVTRELTDFSIKLKPGWKIFDRHFRLTRSSSLYLTFRDSLDLSNFKYIMETYIVKGLKNGTLKAKNGKGLNVDIRNNKVIKDLLISEDNLVPFLKLPIDMIAKDTDPVLRHRFGEYVNAIEELSQYELDGIKVSDLLMLYNLIVNKDSYGSDKMTDLFSTFINNPNRKELLKNSVVYRYYRHMGKIDKQVNEQGDQSLIEDVLNGITLTDVLVMTARVYKYYLNDDGKTATIYSRDTVVKTVDLDGKIRFWRKEGFYKYKSLPLVESTSVLSNEEKEERTINLQRYGFGLLYSGYVNRVVSALSTTNSEESNRRLAILQDLLIRRLIKIIPNCR